MKKEKFLEYFKNVPVSVNNLYGDPFFPLQEENTFKKLDSLVILLLIFKIDNMIIKT